MSNEALQPGARVGYVKITQRGGSIQFSSRSGRVVSHEGNIVTIKTRNGKLLRLDREDVSPEQPNGPDLRGLLGIKPESS